MGPNLAARIAGTIAANTATANSVAPTAPSVSGSYAVAPCSIASTNRVVSNNTALPSASPNPLTSALRPQSSAVRYRASHPAPPARQFRCALRHVGGEQAVQSQRAQQQCHQAKEIRQQHAFPLIGAAKYPCSAPSRSRISASVPPHIKSSRNEVCSWSNARNIL